MAMKDSCERISSTTVCSTRSYLSGSLYIHYYFIKFPSFRNIVEHLNLGNQFVSSLMTSRVAPSHGLSHFSCSSNSNTLSQMHSSSGSKNSFEYILVMCAVELNRLHHRASAYSIRHLLGGCNKCIMSV